MLDYDLVGILLYISYIHITHDEINSVLERLIIFYFIIIIFHDTGYINVFISLLRGNKLLTQLFPLKKTTKTAIINKYFCKLHTVLWSINLCFPWSVSGLIYISVKGDKPNLSKRRITQHLYLRLQQGLSRFLSIILIFIFVAASTYQYCQII